MKSNIFTLLIFLLAPLIWLIWEFVLLYWRTKGLMSEGKLLGTLSIVVMCQSTKWLVIPFIWCGLAGHFFMYRPSTLEIPIWFNGLFICLAIIVFVIDMICNVANITWWWRDTHLMALVGFILGTVLFSQRM